MCAFGGILAARAWKRQRDAFFLYLKGKGLTEAEIEEALHQYDEVKTRQFKRDTLIFLGSALLMLTVVIIVGIVGYNP